MSQKYKSLLNELDQMIPNKDKYEINEAGASQFICSGDTLIKLIEENFSTEEADELTRRLFNSLKGRDPSKIQRKIRQLQEKKDV